MTIAAVLLISGAAWLWPRSDAGRRLCRLGGAPRARRPPRASVNPARLASLAAAVAALLLIGGGWGAVVAVVCVALIPRALSRLESRASRERRSRLAAQAPLLADLLSATMAAGAPMRPALSVVTDAVGEPVRSTVQPILAALELGADAESAWSSLALDPALGPIAQAVMRSAESGAPLSAVLARISEDLRRQHQTSVEVAARSAGVRAVLPLVACFLPAFLLLGVVPVVAALAGGLLGW